MAWVRRTIPPAPISPTRRMLPLCLPRSRRLPSAVRRLPSAVCEPDPTASMLHALCLTQRVAQDGVAERRRGTTAGRPRGRMTERLAAGDPAGGRRTDRVGVADRVLSTLEALEAAPSGLGVTELGRRLGVDKSTAHRL